MRHIQLKRNGKVVTDFDLYDLLIKGDKSRRRHAAAGGRHLLHPHRPGQVAMGGQVNNPAIYEIGAKLVLRRRYNWRVG